MTRLLRRSLPAVAVAFVLALSFLAPVPASVDLVKHCGYGYSYGHCK